MVGKWSDWKAFSCFGRKSSCARVLVIISAWAQRVFHDFIFQACSGGWKTSRNPTRVQSIPPLSKLAGILCREVICPWIHKLLLQNPILPLSRCPRNGAKRQKGTNKKRKKEVWEGKAALLLSYDPTISTVVVQLRGGPQSAVFQVSSDRLTTSTVEVFHSQAEAGCWLLHRGSH